LVNFWIGGAAKLICWTLFCLTSFQIMFTKLVGTSFVFSKLFCWLLEGCKFMDVEANWLNSLCSIETVSVFFFFFNYYSHSCFCSQLFIRHGSFSWFNFFPEHFKIACCAELFEFVSSCIWFVLISNLNYALSVGPQ